MLSKFRFPSRYSLIKFRIIKRTIKYSWRIVMFWLLEHLTSNYRQRSTLASVSQALLQVLTLKVQLSLYLLFDFLLFTYKISNKDLVFDSRRAVLTTFRCFMIACESFYNLFLFILLDLLENKSILLHSLNYTFLSLIKLILILLEGDLLHRVNNIWSKHHVLHSLYI